MVLLHHIVSALSAVPEVYASITLSQLTSFLDVTTRYSSLIAYRSPRRNTSSSVPTLSIDLLSAVAHASEMSVEAVQLLWQTLGFLVLCAPKEEVVHFPMLLDNRLIDAWRSKQGNIGTILV